jgi:hypothetical protein
VLQLQSLDVDKDFLRSLNLTRNDILGRVDEYSLYCHYLGYEPIPHSGRYKSPIRTDDDNPSFGIFYSKKNPDREFLWKDQANGQVGDIFRLVQLMYRYPTLEMADKKVIQDFNLAPTIGVLSDEKIIYHKAPERRDIKIRIHSRPFTKREFLYWSQINIDQTILDYYYATAVEYYWLYEDQTTPYSGHEFMFAYRIYDRYQLYQPYGDKAYKFRNNFTEEYIPGLIQLQFKSPLLIITKSFKDIMFLHSLGYEAISPRSETTPLLMSILPLLEQRYKTIVTLFDNDGKHRADWYNYPELHIPEEFGKDPTDMAREHGVDMASEVIRELMEEYL